MALNGVPMTEEERRSVVQGPGDVEWRYEMRRECQEILPGLLLGPFAASKSLETLIAQGITHIVCIRDAKEAFSVRPRYPDRFQYMVLDVEDNEEQNLIRLFPGAKKFIDDAIGSGGRVLVHCNGTLTHLDFAFAALKPMLPERWNQFSGGISLSPSFVVMFVMQYYQLSWEDALHMVQNRRYCISPNGGFLTQIKEYEAIYKANLAVQSFPQMQRSISRRKREEDEDDEMESRDEDRKRALVKNDTEELDENAMETS